MDQSVSDLQQSISQCMLKDQPRLRGRLRRVLRNRKASPDAQQLQAFMREIAQSANRRTVRATRRPTPPLTADLPILQQCDAICEAIRKHQVVIVCGETGSGKSTQLPQLCLSMGRGVAGLIGHTQPRRIAARSLATRIAGELHSTLGDVVGYKVRFHDVFHHSAYIKLMTDGILLAEAHHDRRLLQYDTIIIDEAHERSLNIDFLLGYLHQLLPKRRELKVIITSATIDPQRFSEHFNRAPIIEVSGRTYPVEIRYRPPEHYAGDDATSYREPSQAQSIVAAVDELTQLNAPSGSNDILVFLPGERDIREAAGALRKHQVRNTEVLPLYARLSTQQQNRVFEPHSGRRIVLATNVAETSLTVPGVRYVIDTGLARVSRYSVRSNLQRLPIEPISQASANQRAGRCGRLSDGVCIRLYDEDAFESREAHTPPEMLRTNLASVILRMKALDLGRIDDFPLLDPPRSSAIREGYTTLTELGALDDAGELTDTGRQLSKLPIDPRLGRMILQASKEHALREVLIIAAALSIQDPRERPMEQADAADVAHAEFQQDESDFLAYLRLWEWYHQRKEELSWSKLRAECADRFVSFIRMREWCDIHMQLRALARELGLKPNAEPAKPDAVHRALLSGLISHVARRNERSASFTAARGGEVHVFPGSCLFKKKPQWLVAAEITETTKRWARCVAKIHPQWIEDLADHLLKKAYRNSLWDPESQQAMTLMRATLYGMEVVRKRRVPLGPIDPKGARELFIHHALVEGDVAMDAPFFEHNQRILREVRSIEARRRKRDVLIGANVRYVFFDERIPANVWNGRAFNKWRRKAEQRDPKALYMTREDLMRHAAADVTPERYPDHLIVAGVPVSVEYTFAPGDPSDGITLCLPLELLDRVSEGQMQWLVPGMLRELVIELVRGLPKSLRSQLAPVPDHVEAILPRLRHGDGSLTRAIQNAVHAQYGYELRDDDWNPADLPDHLRMNYRVLDESGTPIIEGRDLHALRIELSTALEDRFARAIRTADPKYQLQDLTDWAFGDLPMSVELKDGSTTIPAYPALVAQDERVNLTLQADARKARVLHRDGLRLLFMRAIGSDFNTLLDHLPDMDSMAMLATSLPQATDIRSNLLHFIAQRAFLEDDADVRSEAEFRARLQEGWDGIWPVANDAVQRVHAILKAHHELADRLAGRIPPQWAVSVHDITSQRDALLRPGFLTASPYAWLTHMPRHLHALSLRFDKLRHGGHVRDAERMTLLLEWQQKYDAAMARAAESGYTHPALANFFWLLQEYRVWQFAQELGTAISISEKILADQWMRVDA